MGSLATFALVLLLLFPLHDARPMSPSKEFKDARQLLVRGDLVRCQLEAESGAKRFQISDPTWAAEFQLLETEALLVRGLVREAYALLSSYHELPDDHDRTIHRLALEGAVFTHLQKFAEAGQSLSLAENLCQTEPQSHCGEVIRARGVLAVDTGNIPLARQLFLRSLSFAQRERDSYLEATALLNLAVTALQGDRYDEAADWSRAADRVARSIGADYLAEITEGNLGWCYYELGDHERALTLFLDAEKRATTLGSLRDEIKWTANIGYVYQTDGDAARAEPAYAQALELAQHIESKADIITALENLAFVTSDLRKLDEASSYLDQADPLIRASGSHRDELWVKFARGRIAALRSENEHAQTLLTAVLHDPDSQTPLRLEAGHQLARLDEAAGRETDAERTYKSTLATFEQARDQLKKEDSRLPFLANATDIYDDYIHFLVKQDRPLQALIVADQSRARALEQGLGIVDAASPFLTTALDPCRISQALDSTLLFYWLGENQSYLWAITPEKVVLFSLPPRQQLAILIERYSKTLLDLRDPLTAHDADGQALYQMLVAPAAAMIRPNKSVILLDDGVLSKLNFEALLAPGSRPNSRQTADSSAHLHYLIDDLILSSAPSLAMLAPTKSPSGTVQRMLLIGNPISADRDFPSLPMFSFEMSRVGSHFASKQVLGGLQATPAAYVASRPDQYSYIHFVSHAVASSTTPLDSAIILSNTAGQENSYKLYAREIIQHPIRAKLVTISACYGSGTRAYAGEGLVGLSWAFLRAGAHQVIGALWEVSDGSTSVLMDRLYQGLEDGQSPALALHSAKLDLLHAQTRFSTPFYWAPFQIYGRQ